MRIDQKPFTRRTFVRTLGAFLGLLFVPLHQWIGRGLLSQTVFRMLPVPGIRYSRADWNHMKNRLFSSRRALVDELPHRGFIFAVEEKPVLLSRAELDQLFSGRASLDNRRVQDRFAHGRILAAVGSADSAFRSA